jgi:DNA (cytosine-5)-methyltransferase 1
MNYLDLFSGIGGFHLGILQAGVKIDKCYFSEIDKYATQIYKRHFPDAVELGDIKGIKPETLGKIDLITFGFPCQDLSIAGKRAGIRGARSGLFFEAMRLIKQLRPSVFIFENVKGLLTSNEGKDFEVVLREIADIGIYECEWQLVNTSWVLPQNRERIYFIGHLGERSGQKVFPIGEDEELFNPKTNNEIASCFQSTYYKGGVGAGHTLIKMTQSLPDAQRIREITGNSVTLKGLGGGQGAKTGLYAIPVLTPNRKEKRQNGPRFKNNNDPMFTLTAQDLHGIFDGIDIRRLTPKEGLRLQGFPDDYLEGSDTAKYKAIGNAVSVPIVKMIIERLKIS